MNETLSSDSHAQFSRRFKCLSWQLCMRGSYSPKHASTLPHLVQNQRDVSTGRRSTRLWTKDSEKACMIYVLCSLTHKHTRPGSLQQQEASFIKRRWGIPVKKVNRRRTAGPSASVSSVSHVVLSLSTVMRCRCNATEPTATDNVGTYT